MARAGGRTRGGKAWYGRFGLRGCIKLSGCRGWAVVMMSAEDYVMAAVHTLLVGCVEPKTAFGSTCEFHVSMPWGRGAVGPRGYLGLSRYRTIACKTADGALPPSRFERQPMGNVSFSTHQICVSCSSNPPNACRSSILWFQLHNNPRSTPDDPNQGISTSISFLPLGYGYQRFQVKTPYRWGGYELNRELFGLLFPIRAPYRLPAYRLSATLHCSADSRRADSAAAANG